MATSECEFAVKFGVQTYDVRNFVRDHPGGVNTLEKFRGKHISQVMKLYGHSYSAYHMLNDFKVESGQDVNLTGSVSENGRIITKEEADMDQAEIDFLEELESRLDWSKPLLSQLHRVAPHYERWVNSAVYRKCRLFASPVLESLTFTPWYIVPMFWMPIILYLAVVQLREHVFCAEWCEDSSLSGLEFVGHTVFGFFLWSLLEYSLHRWVFHFDPGSSVVLIQLHFLIHGMHHKVPFDGLRQVFPPVPALLLATVLYLPASQLFTHPLIKLTGALIGYLMYDMIHYYVHHGSPRDGTYLYAMKRYHSNHHFQNHDKVLLYLLCASVGTCFSSGWETLLEDLLSDLCPLFSSTSETLNELFLSSEEEDSLITKELVSESFRCGRELAREARQRANKLVRNGVSLEACSPTMLHFFSSKLPSEVKKASELSNELLSATKVLQMKVCSKSDVTPNTFLSFLENNPVRPRDVSCKLPAVACAGSAGTKYRSFDGACNNLQHPAWGRRGAPFTRITGPRYADGIYAMPVARSGRPLPNARALSLSIFSDQPRASCAMTALNMQWGQLVTHDMVFQVMESTDEGGIQCCLGDGRDVLPQSMLNDKCIPICVSEDDPFYRQHGVKCLNFVRSVTAPRDDCSLGYAEQMNTVTSFLDGSTLYGSDPKIAAKLRSNCGGRLKEETRKHCTGGFLPSVDEKLAVCDLRNSSEPCYLAGDSRVNQTPTLAALHTLLLREHNRVADVLAGLNPLWSDEKLFQEARRIVVAEIQHITYQEWLPFNFGESYLRYYRISPSSLYSRDYNAEVNAGVINSFGAAAFRFLHSAVPDSVMLCPKGSHAAYLHKLSDHYFNPSLLEVTPESLDDLIRGALTLRSAEVDPHCTAEITNLLFKSRNKWGLDLVAMDIQRGRDHGLASYNDYREICGLQRATTFQDLAGEISQDRIAALAQLYESVEDVDLLVGGALERAAPGSLLGHTFQCIVAEQFYRTRIGDRFFYDNSEMPHSFTPDQLKELKKASLARLICDNTGVQRVQARALAAEGAHNPARGCDDCAAIPRVDLTAWKRPKFELYD